MTMAMKMVTVTRGDATVICPYLQRRFSMYVDRPTGHLSDGALDHGNVLHIAHIHPRTRGVVRSGGGSRCRGGWTHIPNTLRINSGVRRECQFRCDHWIRHELRVDLGPRNLLLTSTWNFPLPSSLPLFPLPTRLFSRIIHFSIIYIYK